MQFKTANERRIESLRRKCPDIEILSDYTRSDEIIRVCYKDQSICQHEWDTTPTNLKRGRRCPICKVKPLVMPSALQKSQDYITKIDLSFQTGQHEFIDVTSTFTINTDTDGKFQGYLRELTDQYKSQGRLIVHIFKQEWDEQRDYITSILDAYAQGQTPKLQAQNIYPYHLYPHLTPMSKPAEQDYGWDCGKCYNDIYQTQCTDKIKARLDELDCPYEFKDNTFITDKLDIKFIPIIDYQKYGTMDLNRLVNGYNKRIMLLFETQMLYDTHQWDVIKSNIAQALGLTKNRIFARNLECAMYEPRDLKWFFERNQQYGYTHAQKAFALRDKKTKEVYMAYMTSSGYYKSADVSIVRGACKLHHSIVGGATKLWKFLIDYYKREGKHSIVYYIDLNIHNGNSLDPIGAEATSTQRGLWNFWFETERLKNREPQKHKLIMEKQRRGLLMPVFNAGTRTYIYRF